MFDTAYFVRFCATSSEQVLVSLRETIKESEAALDLPTQPCQAASDAKARSIPSASLNTAQKWHFR